ncbi:MAG: type IV secretory system conjugative DNA transfer family protein [Dysgonomonas sp.]
MKNKNICWVLSGTDAIEFDLDITNKKNTKLLCVGNAPDLKDAVSPAISCIGSVIMTRMNQPGKSKSIFLVDELPTVNFQNLEVFTSTARKHNVSTILALQDFSQAERDLGKDSARILRTTCSNQNYGQTGKYETAREVQDMLGEIEKVSDSYTTQDSGSRSETESMKKEKVILARDIMGQPTGHYVGKIINGKPPYYSAQLDLDAGYSEEIPAFSLIVDTGDAEKDAEVMDKIVEANYQRIMNDAKELLKPYQE